MLFTNLLMPMEIICDMKMMIKMVTVTKESYVKEKEYKFLLDVDISKRKFEMKHEMKHYTRQRAQSTSH